ncbi:MAG: TetR/AcrR family transcriptional regulator [Planctomycetes bacterium]|nr:TetR/AcrR family transcriptional regulator [Planctomycetota bacterium]
MRVSQQAKASTRKRILDSARVLFVREGFEHATTRHIAREARIAAGTLFNYFPTKEAIAAALVGEALDAAQEDFERRRRRCSLEEDLFAQVAAGLRRLKPFRRFLRPVLQSTPHPAGVADNEAAAIRGEQMERVRRLLAEHGIEPESPLTLQLYWTLYVGVLGFWTADRSPKQEDTLALLDQSLAMFAAWLRETARPESQRSHN